MRLIVMRFLMWLTLNGVIFPVQALAADDADMHVRAQVSLPLNGGELTGQTVIRFQWLGLTSRLDAQTAHAAFPLVDVGVIFGQLRNPQELEAGPTSPALVIYGVPLTLDGKDHQ